MNQPKVNNIQMWIFNVMWICYRVLLDFYFFKVNDLNTFDK